MEEEVIRTKSEMVIITETVCDYFGFPSDWVMSKSRVKELVEARMWIAYFMKQQQFSQGIIQLWLKRDHSSVWHLLNSKLPDLLDTEERIRSDKANLEALMGERFLGNQKGGK